MINFKWKKGAYTASKDVTVLSSWEKGNMITRRAITLICFNNGYSKEFADNIAEEQFEELVANLGYKRGVNNG